MKQERVKYIDRLIADILKGLLIIYILRCVSYLYSQTHDLLSIFVVITFCILFFIWIIMMICKYVLNTIELISYVYYITYAIAATVFLLWLLINAITNHDRTMYAFVGLGGIVVLAIWKSVIFYINQHYNQNKKDNRKVD